MLRLGKRLLYAAGTFVGVVGLIVVCIVDNHEANARAQCQER